MPGGELTSASWHAAAEASVINTSEPSGPLWKPRPRLQLRGAARWCLARNLRLERNSKPCSGTTPCWSRAWRDTATAFSPGKCWLHGFGCAGLLGFFNPRTGLVQEAAAGVSSF